MKIVEGFFSSNTEAANWDVVFVVLPVGGLRSYVIWCVFFNLMNTSLATGNHIIS